MLRVGILDTIDYVILFTYILAVFIVDFLAKLGTPSLALPYGNNAPPWGDSASKASPKETCHSEFCLRNHE